MEATLSPRFSIIVPAFNPGPFLSDATSSLCAQSFSDFEIIVVDDGSEEFPEWSAPDERFRLLRQANGGVSSARNVGLASAAGEWVVFLDADDLLAPDFLETASDALLHDIDGLYTDVALKWEYEGPDDRPTRLTYGPHGDLFSFLCTQPIAVTSLIARTADVRAAGGFRTEFSGTSEDWDLHLRLTRGRKFIYLPGHRFTYRLHGASETRRIWRTYDGTARMLSTHSLSGAQRKSTSYWLRNWAVREARDARRRGDRTAERGIVRRPELWKWWLVRRLRP